MVKRRLTFFQWLAAEAGTVDALAGAAGTMLQAIASLPPSSCDTLGGFFSHLFHRQKVCCIDVYK